MTQNKQLLLKYSKTYLKMMLTTLRIKLTWLGPWITLILLNAINIFKKATHGMPFSNTVEKAIYRGTWIHRQKRVPKYRKYTPRATFLKSSMLWFAFIRAKLHIEISNWPTFWSMMTTTSNLQILGFLKPTNKIC